MTMFEMRWTRRGLLACAAATAIAPVAAAEPVAEPFPANADEALARLRNGNERFIAGQTRHAHESADWRKHLVAGQKPFATLLGCADSRVPVELVFDQGFGELFVVRVAGNVIAPDVVGSLAYAVEHLSTPIVMVVGHESCGAVTAAVEALMGKRDAVASINELAALIEPGLPPNLEQIPESERIGRAVEANVRWSLKQLALLPEAKRAMDAGRVTLVGAVYELATGRVRFLNP
jgi:carbonic anhydrase